MAESYCCPQCGSEVPGDAPQGLCPNCVLKAGFGTQQADSVLPTGSESASTSSLDAQYVLPTPAELAPHFPDLEILELIRRGGMGVVYKARQKRLDRLVALKILLPKIGQDPAFAERFAREARAMAMLSHPHIVAVYDFGQAALRGEGGFGKVGQAVPDTPLTQAQPDLQSRETGGTLYYFIMEYVDGVHLRRLLNTGKPHAAGSAGDRPTDLRGVAVRTRPRRGPSRHQARKHSARQEWPGEDRRRRPGEIDWEEVAQ